MKFLVLSDIHGSASCLQKALDSFEKDCDAIVICGDYLNHGPRNPLPDGWNTKSTAEILNARKDKIICVRGNCDSEVDEMMLTFPCLNAYSNIFVGKPSKNSVNRIFVHHGHLYTREKLVDWLPKNTLVISGHTHVCVLEKSDGLVWFNSGSVSLPKCEEGKTCGVVEADENGVSKISLYSIEGNLIKSLLV
ncbi:phosphodiesterase [Treponema zioleckii]|uniref:phosphodiesterase n=1 Tax=Treponema zioleckii TaxID=331680 RepID=UPI00168B5803|nr:phosphodiesterase [Treponema zioleckii]